MKKVTVTGGNILYGAFYNCRSVTTIVLGDNITSIGDSAFYSCYSLTSIEIPNSVTSIGDSAFYNCRKLTNIEILDSVTSIGGSAFCACSSLKTVYYKGTAEQWSNISITSDANGYLTDATRYYYSESEPTGSGNYWHYDENGNIAVW